MRNSRLRLEPAKIEVTREEILADLLYPAPQASGGRADEQRTRRRRPRRQGRR